MITQRISYSSVNHSVPPHLPVSLYSVQHFPPSVLTNAALPNPTYPAAPCPAHAQSTLSILSVDYNYNLHACPVLRLSLWLHSPLHVSPHKPLPHLLRVTLYFGISCQGTPTHLVLCARSSTSTRFHVGLGTPPLTLLFNAHTYFHMYLTVQNNKLTYTHLHLNPHSHDS